MDNVSTEDCYINLNKACVIKNSQQQIWKVKNSLTHLVGIKIMLYVYILEIYIEKFILPIG